MKILAWNIRHGGSKQQDLATAMMGHDPEVIVLGEHRRQKSSGLIDHLRLFGWTEVAVSRTEGEDNGVAIVSKIPFELRSCPLGEPPFDSWAVEVVTSGLHVIGIYAPLANSRRSSPQVQREFWDRVHAMAERRVHEPMLMIGDYNTCAPGADGPNALACSDAFEHLATIGWIDAWKAVNRETADFSYVHRAASGTSNWRIDHAFLTPPLTKTISSAWYSHDEREAQLSDHSILLLEIVVDGAITG